jgi:hypothetical protein
LQTLAQHLGQKAAASFHRQAVGLASDDVVPDRQRKSISKETTFEADIRDKVILRDALRGLASDVARTARREGLSGTVVTLKIRFEGFETHTRQHKREASTNDEREILKTAWYLFQNGNLPKKQVRLIGVGISGWEDKQPVQADLFDKPEDPQGNPRLLNIIDAVTEKFGKGCCRSDREGRLGSELDVIRLYPTRLPPFACHAQQTHKWYAPSTIMMNIYRWGWLVLNRAWCSCQRLEGNTISRSRWSIYHHYERLAA